MKNISVFLSALVALLFSVADTSAQITPPYYNPANVNITGGNINGTTIGGTTPAVGSFTTMNASGNALVTGGVRISPNSGVTKAWFYKETTSADRFYLASNWVGSQENTSYPSWGILFDSRVAGDTIQINRAPAGGMMANIASFSSSGLAVTGKGTFTGPTSDVEGNAAVSGEYGNSSGWVRRFFVLRANGTDNGSIGLNMVDADNAGLSFNARTGGILTEIVRVNGTGLEVGDAKTLKVGSGSSTSAGLIAGYCGSSGYGCIWSTGVTPANNNYAFFTNVSDSSVNSTTSINLRIGTISKLSITATSITHVGDMIYDKTITAPGTTGAQTINKTTGRVNFAAAATSLVVTNSLATANSICHVTKATNDATMRLGACVAAAGSITIYADVAPAAETAVNFTVTN